MTFFHGFEYLKDEFSQAQYRSIIASEWLIVALYLSLFVLVIVNIWMILIKLQKWKSLALLFFYIWAFLCISTRLIIVGYGFS